MRRVFLLFSVFFLGCQTLPSKRPVKKVIPRRKEPKRPRVMEKAKPVVKLEVKVVKRQGKGFFHLRWEVPKELKPRFVLLNLYRLEEEKKLLLSVFDLKGKKELILEKKEAGLSYYGTLSPPFALDPGTYLVVLVGEGEKSWICQWKGKVEEL